VNVLPQVSGLTEEAAGRHPLRVIAEVAGAFAASNIARGAIRLLTSLIIARELGQEGFGHWIFCAAWAATLTTALDLGFGVLITRDAARDRRIGVLLSHALAARLGLFLPVGVAFYVVAPHINAAAGGTAALRAAVPLALASIAYGCFSAIFRGWPEYLLSILGLETAGAFVQGGVSWWLLSRGGGVLQLLWLGAAVQASQLVAAAALFVRARESGDRCEWPVPSAVVSAVRRSAPFAIASLIANAQNRMAPLLLGYLSGSAEVALFGAAWRLGNTARAIPSAAFAGALPVLSAGARYRDSGAVKPVFHRALQVFTVTAAVALAIFAPLLVRLTYGPSFSGAAVPLVGVAAGLVPSLLNASRRVYLYAQGREVVALRWSAVALGVQLVACAALASHWGAMGAVVGLALGECVVWWPLAHA
jgi:O-antigen/teichoic acid export membrane protein